MVAARPFVGSLNTKTIRFGGIDGHRRVLFGQEAVADQMHLEDQDHFPALVIRWNALPYFPGIHLLLMNSRF